MITKEEFMIQVTKKARAIVDGQSHDPESCHVDLDDLLCEVLRVEGYGALVEIFEQSYKWYS